MNIDFSVYGFKPTYKITKGSDAGEFLESEFRKHFKYIQKSKRQKYADVWINPKFGYNLKTSVAIKTTGRLCTAQIAEFLSDVECNIKIVHLDYENNNGQIILNSLSEYFFEEIEYNISNQGKGFLQPKVNIDNSFKIRPKPSREEWLNEFKIKYDAYCNEQKIRLDTQNKKFQNLKVNHVSV
jgi:hypothetical protein